MKIFYLLVLSITLISCGKSDSKKKAVPAKAVFDREAVYSAILKPIRKNSHSSLKGAITISKFGDNFDVKIQFAGGPKGKYTQALYSGLNCFIEDSDHNGEIDEEEGTAYFGELMIPFDNDLRSRVDGEGVYPQGPEYEYERSTSYSLMLSDLGIADEDFILGGRAIAILSDNIPVACGTLRMVTEFDQDEDIEEVRMEPVRVPEPTITPEPVEVETSAPSAWQRVRNSLSRFWRRVGTWIRR